LRSPSEIALLKYPFSPKRSPVHLRSQPKRRYSLNPTVSPMKIGRKPKPESPEEMALVHHALENPIRRRMIILMVEGCLSVEGISEAVGPNMLGYHLHRLELAGLIEVADGAITLTEAGEAYGALVKAQAERGSAG